MSSTVLGAGVWGGAWAVDGGEKGGEGRSLSRRGFLEGREGAVDIVGRFVGYLGIARDVEWDLEVLVRQE